MKASLTNPIYTTNIINSSGTTFKIKNITTGLQLSQPEKELAQKVVVSFVNATVNGKNINAQIALRDRVYVYANTGNGEKEVFRGFIWTKKYDSETEKNVTCTCYDSLIYAQQSKDNFFFQKGKTTKYCVQSICKKWGIKLSYTYSSIKHPKNLFRGNYISDTILDLLEETRKKTGKKFVFYSLKDKFYIKPHGTNKTIYHLERKKNVLQTTTTATLDDLVTKVIITGNEDKDKKHPVVATVKGDVKNYGTLQDIITKDKDTKLSEAKKEAKELLKEKGKPKKTYSIQGIDNPWIKKGDTVYIEAGNLKGYYNVLSIERDALEKTMDLEVEKK